MIKNKKITARMLMVCVLTACIFLTGCDQLNNDRKILLTTGFSDDEVFKIGDSVCTLPEIMVYITNMQRQYESVYGDKIWDTTIDGVTLEKNVKEVALARLSQIKAVNLMARDRGMTLTDEELEAVENITDIYYSSLDRSEIEAMGIKRDTIYDLYREYALSQKLYESIIKDVNPEISDDEARTITVQQIYIKTYNYDDDGSVIGYDAAHKAEAKQLAQTLRKRIVDGEDFETLARENSSSEDITVSFGKGDMDLAYEVAAFDLSSGEVSDVVETDEGYYIIKCVSTFNREVTDENKIKIVGQRKQEAFNGEYEDYVSSLTKKLNEETWNSITLLRDVDTSSVDFFEVYEENFR